MTREEKLEAALRAAMRLRRAVESLPEPKLPYKALLIPTAEVLEFDKRIEELKG